MISSQVIRTSIEELKSITKVDLCVLDLEGNIVASTFELNDLALNLITEFVDSPADSQVIGTH
ncbi:MAG: PucR family transcriptional regulator, partial [Lachnospiraceae bacterium]|nr:PucR family transcriptional regulator [Lachnospiraceae bacterium]